MKNKKLFFKLFLCFLFLINVVGSAGKARAEKIEDLNFDKYNTKYISDYANIIDDNVETELNTKLYNFFASTTHQIVVVTVNNMNGDYIEHYSIKLAEKIKAGGEKNDNGVILLIVKDERQMRIEVGYGLEGSLTDGKSSNIIKNIITPEFKNENYTQGIKNGTEEIIRITNEESYAKTLDKKSKVNNLFLKIMNKIPLEFLIFILFVVFGIIQWIISILARTKSWWLGGVFGLIISTVIYFLLFTSLFVFLITIFGFIFDYFISKNYIEHAKKIKDGPPSWWAGGPSFGGGSGWSSSSGDFSSGGGSFGGGGSSGSW